MSGVLGEKAGAMLFASRLPEAMWRNVANCVLPIQPNTKRNQNGVWKRPFELFYGKKPMLHYLKAIGCKCWVRLPIHKFHKYQERAAEGVMVGYDNEKTSLSNLLSLPEEIFCF